MVQSDSQYGREKKHVTEAGTTANDKTIYPQKYYDLWEKMVESVPEFMQEYLCKYVEPTEHEKLLERLAKYYYETTEEFDRLVCTGPIGKDGILPATSREKDIINKHASNLFHLLISICGDEFGLKRAMDRYIRTYK